MPVTNEPEIESLSALTLSTHVMKPAVRFYAALGFALVSGGEGAPFSVFKAGGSYINLALVPPETRWAPWGRFVVYVSDVDAQYAKAIAAGYTPSFEPRDAAWGERYFHISDPDGHELSFARRLRGAKSE